MTRRLLPLAVAVLAAAAASACARHTTEPAAPAHTAASTSAPASAEPSTAAPAGPPPDTYGTVDAPAPAPACVRPNGAPAGYTVVRAVDTYDGLQWDGLLSEFQLDERYGYKDPGVWQILWACPKGTPIN